MDEAGDAVRRRTVDDEVGRRFTRSTDLGPDTGIVRDEGSAGECGPVLPDLGLEGGRSGLVDAVGGPGSNGAKNNEVRVAPGRR